MHGQAPGQKPRNVENDSFLTLAVKASVVRRAVLTSLIVGHVLAVINHGDKFAAGDVTATDALKVILTFLVPYSVSTISSVLSLREQAKPQAEGESA